VSPAKAGEKTRRSRPPTSRPRAAARSLVWGCAPQPPWELRSPRRRRDGSPQLRLNKLQGSGISYIFRLLTFALNQRYFSNTSRKNFLALRGNKALPPMYSI
jgi:hypothetical protein